MGYSKGISEEDLLLYAKTSDNVRVSVPDEKSTTSETGEILEKVQLNISGYVKVQYKIKPHQTGKTVTAKLYVDDDLKATDSSTSASYVTKTHEVHIAKGSMIKVEVSTSNSDYPGYIKDFKIMYDTTKENEVLI